MVSSNSKYNVHSIDSSKRGVTITNILAHFKGTFTTPRHSHWQWSNEQVCHWWSSTKATRESHCSKWVMPQLILFCLDGCLIQSFIFFPLHISWLHAYYKISSCGWRIHVRFLFRFMWLFLFHQKRNQNEEATTWQ